MLLWVALAFLAGAVVVAGRWALHPRDGLRRPRPFPVFSVALLALVGGGLLVPVVRHDHLERRLSAVASELVGKHVVVHCQTAGQEFLDAGAELGYVRYRADGVPEHATLIKRDPCLDLRAYLSSTRDDPSRDEVVAVHVLSHEARHMAGVTAEAVAECQAMQRDAQTARLLGARPDQAALLAVAYWRLVYPQMPDDYRSPDCRAGGPLDERLPDAPWAPLP